MNQEPLVLDVDLSAVDTSIPVLPPALYDLRVRSITREENKEKTGFNAKIVFETTATHQDMKGVDVKEGFPLTAFYSLQNKADAADPEQWKKNFAMLQDAALGCSMGSRPPRFDASDIINKIVRANVKVEKYNDMDRNAVGQLTYPT